MKRIPLAVFAAALLLPVCPVVADDPPSPGEDAGYGAPAAATAREASPSSQEGATDTIQVEEIPNGAASMEPAQNETPEDRSERAFIENVWNSP